MPKYSPINVVKIKKEIERYSFNLEIIINTIKEKQQELENVRQELKNEKILVQNEQEKISKLWNDIADKLSIVQSIKKKIEQDIISLENDRKIVKSQVDGLTNILHETTLRLSSIPTKNTLLDSLINESKNILSSIIRKKE